jgi:hypothetical protein
MLVLDAFAMNYLQPRIAPMGCPMLADADVRNELVINVRALPDQFNDDVGHFFEDAKVAVRDGMENK